MSFAKQTKIGRFFLRIFKSLYQMLPFFIQKETTVANLRVPKFVAGDLIAQKRPESLEAWEPYGDGKVYEIMEVGHTKYKTRYHNEPMPTTYPATKDINGVFWINFHIEQIDKDYEKVGISVASKFDRELEALIKEEDE